MKQAPMTAGSIGGSIHDDCVPSVGCFGEADLISQSILNLSEDVSINRQVLKQSKNASFLDDTVYRAVQDHCIVSDRCCLKSYLL